MSTGNNKRAHELPPEIIFHILKLAVPEHRLTSESLAWNLRLISRGTQIWIDNILFESLFIGSSQALFAIFDILQSRSLWMSVRHLFISSDPLRKSGSSLLLINCNALRSFISGYSNPATNPADILSRQRERWVIDPSALSNCRRLTHVEILVGIKDSVYMDFGWLPHLTHLSFSETYSAIVSDTAGNTKKLSDILRACPRLEMLLVLVSAVDVHDVEKLVASISALIYVYRSQSMSEDWVDHLKGENVWLKAKQARSLV